MKDFAILFAILGLCIQHASAAVIRAPAHTSSIELTSNSFPIKKSATHIFYESDYLTPTEGHTEDESFSDLALRADVEPNKSHTEPLSKQLLAVVKCMFEALPGPTFVSEREVAQSSLP
ncbi:hypothetical protein VE04_07341 [Pseudogymnoascus sp. 24MN13]|nr:hypothetical protein VE04_07341 [Pseudogymnoascus sp. 24MN13]